MVPIVLLLLLAFPPAPALGRLNQKGGVFKHSHIRALGGKKCVNLAYGKIEVGVNVQTWDCKKVDENFYSYTEKAQIHPKGTTALCFQVEAAAGHNVLVAKCSNDVSQKFDFLSNGQIMSRAKFADHPKGTCLNVVGDKSATANIIGGNCDANERLQKFSVDDFQPATTATAKKPEAKIEYNQRLVDRQAFHKVKTQNGCYCKASWTEGSQSFEYPNNCANPGGLKEFNWCFTIESEKCKGVDGHHHWDRCTPPAAASVPKDPTKAIMSKAGCKCQDSWSSNGRVFAFPNNCGDPDNIVGQNWCYVAKGSCGTSVWDYCTPIVAATTQAAAAAAATKPVAVAVAKPAPVAPAAPIAARPVAAAPALPAKATPAQPAAVAPAAVAPAASQPVAASPALPAGAAGAPPAQPAAVVPAAALPVPIPVPPQPAAPVAPAAAAMPASTPPASAVAAMAGFKPANPQCGHGDLQADQSCICHTGYSGERCGECAPGFLYYPACSPSSENGAPMAAAGPTVLELQPHHHRLLFFFGTVLLLFFCGCICRGGMCLRIAMAMRKRDNRLPDL